MALERLYEPLVIRGTPFKNRIVFPPCVVALGEANGAVNDTALAYYEARARGGAGTVIVEAAYVRDDGKIEPGEVGIQDDSMVPGLRRLATAIHRHGSVAVIQINHCGRQGKSKVVGCQTVSSSAIPSPVVREVPRAMSTAEVREMVEAYAAAAVRAREAGFDGVEIHGAHGYLVAQFMSPCVNQRDDEYGGDADRRMRFPLEMVKAIRERCGERFLIFFRLSAEEYVPGGLTIADTKPNAQRLAAAGVDLLHVSVGTYETSHYTAPLASHPRGSLVHFAEAIKAVVNVPVITVGKITDAQFAEEILRAGKADMIAIGRGLMADPEFPNKVAAGRDGEIQKCIGCRTCFRMLFRGRSVRCPVNPAFGLEAQFLQPIAARKRVLVAGNGPAALDAAWVAGMRGHEVTLSPGDGPLGGELAKAAGPKNDEAAMILKYIASRLPRLGVAVLRGANGAGAGEQPDIVLVEQGDEGHLARIGGVPALVPRQELAGCPTPRGLIPALEEGTRAALAV